MSIDAGEPNHGRSIAEHWLWPDRNPEAPGAAFARSDQQHQAFLNKLERSGFNWLVFIVAASGFFTDSYNLFASNVILPALAFVYWDGPQHGIALGFNLATLGASVVGQLVFGVFADMFGRRSLYGIELMIVIVSTVGLLQCSPGYTDGQHSTWSVTGWLLFWRTIMGLGIGAEYPLSACIAAEWSSTKSRGRMISAVFLMQPIGQLCAYGAGLTALRCFGSPNLSTKVDIDKLWRYVIGVGVFPTLLALCFRLFMPESGRYTYDVRKKANEAQMTDSQVEHDNDTSSDTMPDVPKPDIPDTAWNQFRVSEIWNCLYHEGQWIYLVGTSLAWLLLDFAFYGLGFNNPATLAKLWSSQNLNYPPSAPWWLRSSNVFNPTNFAGTDISNTLFPDIEIEQKLIHEVLETNMLHAIYTVSIPSIIGSLMIIACINKFDRKNFLTVTFVLLGIMMVIICASFEALFHQEGKNIVLIIFWMVISFLFSFGPNTLTFIIPAEIFPTRYRCTFYGIAAAWGKIGAVLIQVVMLSQSDIGNPNSTEIRWLLLGFALCMLLGAVVSHFMLPHVQKRSIKPRYVNIPLEEIPSPQEVKSRRRRVRDEHEMEQA